MDHKLQAKTMVHPFPVVTEQVFCSVIYIHTYFPVILQQLCLENQKICKQILKNNNQKWQKTCPYGKQCQETRYNFSDLKRIMIGSQ